MNIFKEKLFSEKVAIVTGGSSGIGEKISETLAELGAQVVIVNRNKINGKKIERKLLLDGYKALHITADISKYEDILMIVDETIKKFGKIDILINSAGIVIRKKVEDFTEDDLNKIININLKGVFLCCQKVGEKMIKQNHGKIVNIGSVGGEQVIPFRSIYNGSKAAIHAISKSMAIEWAKYNINVNVIAPGMILTPLTEKYLNKNDWGKKFINHIPRGKLGMPEDIAKMVVFLVSEDANHITGQTIFVDGGWTAGRVLA